MSEEIIIKFHDVVLCNYHSKLTRGHGDDESHSCLVIMQQPLDNKIEKTTTVM